MRIMIINPNTSVGVTNLILETARSVAAAGTELSSITAPVGVPYVASRAEAAIAGTSVLEILASHQIGYDAAVIAAFGDPGVGAARELFALPIVGLAEAGMLTACMLGRTFSIVTFSRSLVPWYRECMEWNGMANRCASIRSLDQPFSSISNVQEEKADLLVSLAEKAVTEDGADVVILGGAPLAGLASVVKDRIPVPTIDCVAAAIKQAEALVTLGARKPVAGTYQRPGPKQSTGLDPALADWLAHR